MNLKTLMLAELSGAGKGTKGFSSEGSSDLSPSKKQRKAMMDLGFRDEEDDGEEVLPNLSKTNDRGHVPPLCIGPLAAIPTDTPNFGTSVQGSHQRAMSWCPIL